MTAPAFLSTNSRTPQRASSHALVDEPAEPACCRSAVDITFTPRLGEQALRTQLHYLWLGAPGRPTVIVQGGISAGRDVCASPARKQDGWWQALVGPGKAIDTNHVRVLAVDWLDADQLGVQAVTSEDQADAIAMLLDQLAIKRVRAWVGCSYGAMVGLAFAARHGARLAKLVALAGAHRPHPLSSAQRAVQRGILELGLAAGREHEAVALARQLALTTYRGSTELAERFAGPATEHDGHWQTPVEPWLQHNGAKFAQQCSARRYQALSQSIDLHRVDPAQVHVPVHLIGFASDRLVPLADLCELQGQLAGHATLDVVESRYGHDGFLLEHDALEPLLADAVDVRSAQQPNSLAPFIARSA